MKRVFIIFFLVAACFFSALFFDLLEITPKGMKYLHLIADSTMDFLKKAALMLGDLLKSVFDEVVFILKKWFAKITA